MTPTHVTHRFAHLACSQRQSTHSPHHQGKRSMADVRLRWTHGNRLLGLLGRSHTIIVVTTCLLLLSSCASVTTPISSRGHSASPTASASYGVLPHFSDWRAAYLAPDGRAHVVTLDGKTDLTGPLLPDLTSMDFMLPARAWGPDGKTLAYAARELDLVDLTGQTPPRAVQVYGGFNNIMWSPNQHKLYSDLGGGQFFYLTLTTGQPTTVAPGDGVGYEVGWIDDTHIAAVSSQGSRMVDEGAGGKVPTSVKLDSLDLTSDQARTITTIQGGGPTVFQFVISPDGSQALYYNASYLGLAFTPQVAVINLATGHVTPLPTIAQATGADFFRVAWRPGTNTIAVSTSQSAEDGGLKTWLLDVQADRATSIAPTGNPMGWAPNNGPLALSSGYQSGVGEGPYILTAVTCLSSAQCSTATLAKNAMTFTFLGFVRNP